MVHSHEFVGIGVTALKAAAESLVHCATLVYFFISFFIYLFVSLVLSSFGHSSLSHFVSFPFSSFSSSSSSPSSCYTFPRGQVIHFSAIKGYLIFSGD